MKVAVLGSESWPIGRAVTLKLKERDFQVVCFDRLRMPRDYPGYAGEDAPTVQRFLGDVRDSVAVSEVVSIADAVIHLASVDDNEKTEDDPSVAIETNLIGSLNVFQACRLHVRRCSYLVPFSLYSGVELAYLFNRKHDAEIAVVLPAPGYDPLEVADLMIEGILSDHFTYDQPLTPAIVTR